MKHKLEKLPYKIDALEPYISKETIKYHYGKHHFGYVEKLNNLILDTEFVNMSLIDIIKNSKGSIFNNAAQVFNHNFYWLSLSPNKTEPSIELLKAIKSSFSSFDSFKNRFIDEALKIFGSGWCWLILDNRNSLKIVSTSNAHTPIEKGLTPLLTCDVWEHAYYLDYKNERKKYIDNFFKIVNWENASNIYINSLI